mmetsp:Transcript_13852/g.22628  ORF Transcript_13852/g.22628 Transcript_13852/m.22628 type:complete len:126 (-) Transcript_13852:206-583(-)
MAMLERKTCKNYHENEEVHQLTYRSHRSLLLGMNWRVHPTAFFLSPPSPMIGTRPTLETEIALTMTMGRASMAVPQQPYHHATLQSRKEDSARAGGDRSVWAGGCPKMDACLAEMDAMEMTKAWI